ncbi:MAG: YicC/YloC family endoribonuclease [Tissierellia bacterium]|nr:YicC/YloC family endoribonuclease [Tissierellia bacterium]
MRSMTGYGRSEMSDGNFNIKIEMKSVNQRYFDSAIRLPRNLLFLEDSIRSKIKAKISRGRIDVFINFDILNDELNKISINTSKAIAYKNSLEDLVSLLNLDEDVNLRNILLMEDIMKTDGTDLSKDESLKELIFSCLDSAIDSMISMKVCEGENINNDLKEKLQIAKLNIDKINNRAPIALKENIKSLTERVEERLKDFNLDLIEDRLYNEIVFYTDRLSIDEELTRLYSHIDQFSSCLTGMNPIGKRLDFIIQEFNREINTIGSKSQDTEIINTVIELKSIVEMMREQIQNIE